MDLSGARIGKPLETKFGRQIRLSEWEVGGIELGKTEGARRCGQDMELQGKLQMANRALPPLPRPPPGLAYQITLQGSARSARQPPSSVHAASPKPPAVPSLSLRVTSTISQEPTLGGWPFSPGS